MQFRRKLWSQRYLHTEKIILSIYPEELKGEGIRLKDVQRQVICDAEPTKYQTIQALERPRLASWCPDLASSASQHFRQHKRKNGNGSFGMEARGHDVAMGKHLHMIAAR